MNVKGLNKLYDVTIERSIFRGKKGIAITAGNLMTGLTSVMISEENWEKLKKGV